MTIKRIYHTWDKWECYPAGFYESKPKDKSLTAEAYEHIYTELLRDLHAFEAALVRVTSEWRHSCEHYLTNENMNRIAWLGQASLCIAKGIPSCFRGGFNRLSEQEQYAANQMALKWLNRWLTKHGDNQLMLADAQSKTQADLY
jgi:hypothetical protein